MKRFFRLLCTRNEKGFSLAEIMVAAGMLGILSLGVMQVMKNTSKSSKKLQEDSELTNFIYSLRSQLRNSDSCIATLGDVNTAGGLALNAYNQDFPGNAVTVSPSGRADLDPTGNLPAQLDTIPVVTDLPDPTMSEVYGVISQGLGLGGTSRILYRAGCPQTGDLATQVNLCVMGGPGGRVWLEKMVIGNFNPQFPDPVSPNLITGEATIRVTFRRGPFIGQDIFDLRLNDPDTYGKLRERTFGQPQVNQDFPIKIQIDTNNNNIVRCVTDFQNSLRESCDSLNGFLDQSGKCNNLVIQNQPLGVDADPFTGEFNSSDFALSTVGNVYFRNGYPAAGVPVEGGASTVRGSVGIGLQPNNSYNHILDVSGGISVGVTSMGDVDFQSPTGAGTGVLKVTGASFHVGGSVVSGNGLKVGAHDGTIFGGEGFLRVDNGIGIGMDPDPASPTGSLQGSGNMEFTGNGIIGGNLAVGTTMVSPAGGFGVINTLGDVVIGVGGPGGDLRAQNDAYIAQDMTVTGVSYLNDDVRIGSPGFLVVNGTFDGGANSSSVVVSGGIVTTNPNAVPGGNPALISPSDAHFATVAYVKKHMAETIDPGGQLANLLNYIDAASDQQIYEVVKNAICTDLGITVEGGATTVNALSGSDCTFGTWDLRINAGVLELRTSKGGDVLIASEDLSYLDENDCSVLGECNIVYATSQFCLNGNCYTTMQKQICPSGYYSIGISRGYVQCTKFEF